MAWYKVDDKLHSHPKARQAGLPAIGLWALAGSHCMDYLTDGLVEAWFVESFPDGMNLAARLVAVGMWDEDPKGFRFHDWLEYQPTAQKVRDTREARSAAGQKGGMKSGEVRREANDEANPEANASAKTKQKRTPSPSPSPSPIPTTQVNESSHLGNRENAMEQAARRTLTGLEIDPDRLTTHIRDRVKLVVEASGALRLALHILDKGNNVKTPQAYVLSSITQHPGEIEQFIHENALTA
jgi:hypothetical protein